MFGVGGTADAGGATEALVHSTAGENRKQTEPGNESERLQLE